MKDIVDGRWSWVICSATFFMNLIRDGIVFSFGNYVDDLAKHFKSSHKTVGAIGSLLLCLSCSLAGLIGSCLTHAVGCRVATVVGTVAACAGMIAAALVNSLAGMFFFFGLVTGVGSGVMNQQSLIIIPKWFEKRRSLAMGLSLCGTGIGASVFVVLTQMLIQNYGWKGSLLIQSGLMLNCLVCAMLYRPFNKSMSDQNASAIRVNESEISEIFKFSEISSAIHKDEEVEASTETFDTLETEASAQDQAFDDVAQLNDPKREKNEHFVLSSDSDQVFRYGQYEAIKNRTDIALDPKKLQSENILKPLKNFYESGKIRFLLFPGVFVAYLGLYIPLIFLFDRLLKMEWSVSLNDPEKSKHLVSLLLTLSGIFFTVGRLSTGWMVDQSFCNKLVLFEIFLFLSGFSSVISGLFYSYHLMGIYIIIIGYSIGTIECLLPLVSTDLFGLDHDVYILSIAMVSKGFGIMIGPPIAGAIFDRGGEYDGAFYFSGLCTIFGFLILIPTLIMDLGKKQNHEERRISLLTKLLPAI